MENSEADRDLIRRKIESYYDPGFVKRVTIQTVETQFDIGRVYYAEFDTDEPDDGDEDEEAEEENFFYALVTGSEVALYDDGIQVIQALNTELQRKKSFWQRFGTFTLVDAVGASIAILVALTFVGSTAAQCLRPTNDTSIYRDLASIFTVIVGYYFGRITGAGSKSDRH